MRSYVVSHVVSEDSLCLDETVPIPVQQVARRMPLHLADLLLPGAAGLWAFGVSRTNITAIGAFGLPPLLPVAFYAGVGLLVVSAVTELIRAQLTHWRMALHAIVLTIMLYGTAPLLYSEGRYSWLYKTIGVVQYVDAHGHLNGSIDIYQNWPGFFALAGWFGKVAGVASPLAYAKWAQLLFELAALAFLYLIYDALSMTARQRWVALLLVPASNWIGQDYFSPQALGTLLGLGIMAMAMRWLFVASPAPRRALFAGRWRPRRVLAVRSAGFRPGKSLVVEPVDVADLKAALIPYARTAGSAEVAPGDGADVALGEAPGTTTADAPDTTAGEAPATTPADAPGTTPADAPDTAPGDLPSAKPGWLAAPWHRGLTSQDARRLKYCAIIVLVFFVLSFTHQLSPYMLVVQLGALAFFRMLRPRWLPLVLLAVAVGYLLPRFSYVSGNYGLLTSIGNLFSNLTPPALIRAPAAAPSQRLIEHCAEALSIGIWILALLGAWRARRSGKIVFALLLLAFSPVAVLAFLAYGHEGILRVYLFSLPWSAALAAMAVAPTPALTDKPPNPGAAANVRAAVLWNALRKALRAIGVPARPFRRTALGDGVRSLLVLGIALALFFPSFFADDSFNYMSREEVDIVTSFLRSAPVGIIYCPFHNAPLADTSRYNLFPRPLLFGYYGMLGKGLLKPDVARTIAQNARQRAGPQVPAYVLITPSMVAYNEQYRETPARNFAILRFSLAHSSRWKLLVNRAGIVIYELVPRLPRPEFRLPTGAGYRTGPNSTTRSSARRNSAVPVRGTRASR